MTPGPRGCRELLGLLWDCRVAVFDLDGTLYDDASYYAAADRDIACHLARVAGIPVADAAAALARSQEPGGRAGYLDRVCEILGLPRAVIANLLRLLRTVDVQLIPYSWVEALLADLAAHGVALYVLTNGNREQQQNKIRSTGLDAVSPPLKVVYASDHRPKPDPAGLRHIIAAERAEPRDVVLVGNDRTDELCALACGAAHIDAGQLHDCFREITELCQPNPEGHHGKSQPCATWNTAGPARPGPGQRDRTPAAGRLVR